MAKLKTVLNFLSSEDEEDFFEDCLEPPEMKDSLILLLEEDCLVPEIEPVHEDTLVLAAAYHRGLWRRHQFLANFADNHSFTLGAITVLVVELAILVPSLLKGAPFYELFFFGMLGFILSSPLIMISMTVTPSVTFPKRRAHLRTRLHLPQSFYAAADEIEARIERCRTLSSLLEEPAHVADRLAIKAGELLKTYSDSGGNKRGVVGSQRKTYKEAREALRAVRDQLKEEETKLVRRYPGRVKSLPGLPEKSKSSNFYSSEPEDYYWDGFEYDLMERFSD